MMTTTSLLSEPTRDTERNGQKKHIGAEKFKSRTHSERGKIDRLGQPILPAGR